MDASQTPMESFEELQEFLKLQRKPSPGLATLQARMALLAFLGQRLQEDAELKVGYDYWVGRLGLE